MEKRKQKYHFGLLRIQALVDQCVHEDDIGEAGSWTRTEEEEKSGTEKKVALSVRPSGLSAVSRLPLILEGRPLHSLSRSLHGHSFSPLALINYISIVMRGVYLGNGCGQSCRLFVVVLQMRFII